MGRLIGFVDYAFNGVAIPASRTATCYAAVKVWAHRSYADLTAALKAHHHEFTLREAGGLNLTWIDLDTEWGPLESFYKLIAPFVLPEGEIYCVDEEQQHICYRFQHSQVFRIRGRVTYDGAAIPM